MTQTKPRKQPRRLTPAELAEIHQLPDEALVTTEEAAAFLRLKVATLAWYRCMAGVNNGGPPFTRMGLKAIRYRMGDLRAHATRSNPISEGIRRSADAMLAARVAKGQVHA